MGYLGWPESSPTMGYRCLLNGASIAADDLCADRLEQGRLIVGQRSCESGAHHPQLRSRTPAGLASVNKSAELGIQ